MKTLLPILMSISLISGLSAQSYESTDDRGYKSTYKRIMTLPDNAWISIIDYNNFGQTPYPNTSVQYFDSNGQLQWELSGSMFYPGHIREVLLTNNRIILFNTAVACDVGQSVPLKVWVVDFNGEVLFDNLIESDIYSFEADVKGCSAGETNYVVSSYSNSPSPFSSQLIAVDSEASELWTLLLQYEEIHHIAAMNEDAVIFSNGELMQVNAQGEKVDSLAYAEIPTAVASANDDKILMLLESGLFELNADLVLTEVMNYPVPNVPDNLLFESNHIHLVYNDAIYVYDENYMIVDSIFFEALPNFTLEDVAMNSENYFLSGNRSFQTTIHNVFAPDIFWTSTAAYRLIPSEDEIPVHFPDAALSNLNLSNYNSTNHSADAEFYLVNEGDVILDSVQVNFVAQLNPITCSVFGKVGQFYDLALEPGDSVLLNMDYLSFGYPFNSEDVDSTQIEYCIYVTQPNRMYDRVIDNDQVCSFIDFGVGISELSSDISHVYPNPANEQVTIEFTETSASEILQVFDVTGRQIEEVAVSGHNQLTLNVADWNAGLYYFRTISEGVISKSTQVSIVR